MKLKKWQVVSMSCESFNLSNCHLCFIIHSTLTPLIKTHLNVAVSLLWIEKSKKIAMFVKFVQINDNDSIGVS